MNRLAELQSGGAGNDLNTAIAVADEAQPRPTTASRFTSSGGSAPFTPRETDEDYINPADTDKILENFYRLVADVQTGLRDIEDKTAEIQSKYAQHIQTADMEAAEALGAEIEEMRVSINQRAMHVKDCLQVMADNTSKLRATPQDEAANTAVIKIQQNQHRHLLRSFQTAMNAYQAVQAESKKEYHEQTARRIKMKYTNDDGTTIDDERAQELAREVLDMGKEDVLFQQSKDTLAQIIETRNDIFRIEASMRELNQLFNDLAVLVSEQGEVMDQIFNNVERSLQYVEKGRNELEKAKKYAGKSRRKMFWLFIIVFIIFLFILAPILGATVKK